MAEQFCLRWNNHQSTLVSVFENLLESETLTDCTLAAEGRYLKAHKVVLSACSPYFESILCQHYDKHPIVVLKDVKFYEMRAMLDYMYKGEVNISQDQLDAFIKTAESLQIKGLTDQGSSGGSGNVSGNMGGESDDRDVGSTIKRRGSGRDSCRLPDPEVPLVSNTPLREGSISPTTKRRRRQQRHSSSQDNHLEASNSCDIAPHSSTPTIASQPPLPRQPTPDTVSQIIKKTEPPDIVQPKIEMDYHSNDDIEDLTLDDEEDYSGSGGGDMSKPGTSFSGHSNQDYSQWQITNERSADEVFMAAQEAINNQSNSQDEMEDIEVKPKNEPENFGRRRRHKSIAAFRSGDFIFYTDGIQMMAPEDTDWDDASEGRTIKRKVGGGRYRRFLDDETYRVYRERNNESCKRSRLNRKFRELQLYREAEALECKNVALKNKVKTIEQLKDTIKDKLHCILLNKDLTM